MPTQLTTPGRPLLATPRGDRELYDSDLGQTRVGAPITDTDTGHTYRGHVLWGENDRKPLDLCALANENPLISAAMEFKSALLYGDGAIPCRRYLDGDTWRYTPCYDYPEVNQFLEDNDVNATLFELALDLIVLGNAYPELVANRAHTAIAELRHKEAVFSRLEEANPATGQVEHHFYSTRWGGATTQTAVYATPTLPSHATVRALRCYLGLETDPTGRHRHQPRAYSWVLPTVPPSLGHPYYARPWWESVVSSGWLRYAQEIPEFKRALLRNATQLRYHVKLHPQFWDRYFQQKGAHTDAAREAARREWYARLDAFLSDNRNAGRSFISDRAISGDKPEDLVTIETLQAQAQGGELLTDLEETSNILAYGMGVHPSLIGASPGHNKSINGTEARELFIIKQALLRPLRQRLLRPLYLVKAANGWPADLHFTISNLELTALSQGTGAVRHLGQPAVDEL